LRKFKAGFYEPSFNKAIALNPNAPDAWLNKGNSFIELDKHVEALECFDKAINLKPNYTIAFSNKGTTLAMLGKYKEAIEQFDKAIEFGSDFDGLDKVYFGKASALSQLNKNADSVTWASKAIELNPNDPQYYVLKMTGLTLWGKHNRTTKVYQEGMKKGRNFFDEFPGIHEAFGV
jgi:tetratricopeptide (TPR) repeat protein